MTRSSHRWKRSILPFLHSGTHRPQRSLVEGFARGVVLAGALGIATPAGAQQTTFIAERGISLPPQDVAITPNGLIAVVRSAGPAQAPIGNPTTDEITVWDVPTGTRIPIADKGPELGRGKILEGYTSDGIAITNDVAVVIGSAKHGLPDTKTMINVIRLSGVSAWSAGEFNVNFQSAGQDAGLASDVEITPDGRQAVVNHRNWVHIIDLVTTDPATAVGHQIGASTFGPCSPGPQSDSVALTNTRAVVVSTRDATGNALVFIYNISSLGSSSLLAAYEIASGSQAVHPHDVAITPDGTKAIATFKDRFALFDLASGGKTDPPGTHIHSSWDRQYGLPAKPVDSVELTNDRAVLLAYDTLNDDWAVEIWDIAPTLQFVAEFQGWMIPGSQNHMPHDLALHESDGKIYALVTTGRATFGNDSGMQVAFLGVEATPTVHIATNFATPFAEPGLVFCSDSAAFLVSDFDPKLWGLAMGSGQFFSPWIAVSRKIDFSSPPVFHNLYLGAQHPDFDTIAVDLAKTHGGTDYFMRTFAPPGEADPAAGGRDFLRARVTGNPPAPQVIAQLGGIGESNNLRMLAVDSIASSGDYTVSIAELTSGLRRGYVHFVRNTL